MTDAKDPRTYAIIGAAMEVHRVLGCGFLEPVYQKALAVEFSKRKIPYRSETKLSGLLQGGRAERPVSPRFHLLRQSGSGAKGAGKNQWNWTISGN